MYSNYNDVNGEHFRKNQCGILGNSVFSGHIQCHNLSSEICDRVQYMSPIWLRPMYNDELLVKGTKQSHIVSSCNLSPIESYQLRYILGTYKRDTIKNNRALIKVIDSSIPKYRYNVNVNNNIIECNKKLH